MKIMTSRMRHAASSMKRHILRSYPSTPDAENLARFLSLISGQQWAIPVTAPFRLDPKICTEETPNATAIKPAEIGGLRVSMPAQQYKSRIDDTLRRGARLRKGQGRHYLDRQWQHASHIRNCLDPVFW
jgi:hypothetical protein